MPITPDQLPERFRSVITDQEVLFDKGRVIEVRKAIPNTPDIPIEDQRKWLKIPHVTCVFTDILGSTKVAAHRDDKDTAGMYQLFTGTAVRLFDRFDAPYIEVQGDAVFALFNEAQPYRAVAAAITIKTFAQEVFGPRMKKDFDADVACHIGIDRHDVLVRKIGLKRVDERTDRQNEVWAGEPVNMASKLASLTKAEELLASDRFIKTVPNRHVKESCSCSGSVNLWEETDLSNDERFTFKKAYRLRSKWCGTHGREYCEKILTLD